MADLTLRINGDFKDAQKAFQELANSSEETRAKIEKFSESFQTEQVNKFIDKQKLLESALTGTRGSVEAMKQASNNYQREIERLIKSGLDPESEAVQKLAQEQEKLKQKIQEANEIQKAQESLMKGAEKACLAMWAAIGTGVVATAALTQKTAELGNELAKSSQRLGVNVEALQELDYAAKQSGVSDFRSHLDKLNKTMGDVKSGTGSLTKYLNDNDKQLLGQLKNVKSNDEAFMLLMDSISRAPDEFTKAKLATEYFGKAGKDLIVMANSGTEGIAALREEAQKYGIMTTESAKRSEEYLDAQVRLKAALQGVATELTTKLMPGITESINGLANFIANIDNWEAKLKTAAVIIGVVTIALTAFVAITKLSGIVAGFTAGIAILTKAFAAFNAVLLANPLILIITGIVAAVALLSAGIIAIIKNWDTVQTYLEQGIARLEYAFKWLGSQIKEKLIIAFNAVKIAGVTLIDFIYGNIVRAVERLLEVMGKLPFVGEMFNDAAVQVNRLGNAIGNLAEETRQNSRDVIQAAIDEQNATQQALNDRLSGIDEEARARRAAIDEMKKQTDEEMGLQTEAAEHEIAERERTVEAVSRVETAKANIQLQSLKERLNQIALTENQALNQQINEVASFLQQRAALESDSHIERIAYLEEQKNELLALYEEGSQERIAIERAADEAIKKSREEQAEAEKALLEQRLSAVTGFMSGIGQLLEVAGEKNRAAAVVGKVLASAEAGINTALAATKSLTAAPYPFNLVLMAGTIAAGIAQQIKIASTPIPSAETGGRFIVPNSSGVDSVGLKVNPGEQIDVTPRGMAGQNENFNFNFVFDGRVFAEIINKQARAGELYTLALAGNL